MKNTTIEDCKVINLPKIHTIAGDITAIHNNEIIPFDVKRVYYIYDVPNKSDRGGHAHKELFQLVVAISGSFQFDLFDGFKSKTVVLNQPDQGLLLVPGIWRDLHNFSGGAVCLVLASACYQKVDYIRDKELFKTMKMSNG